MHILCSVQKNWRRSQVIINGITLDFEIHAIKGQHKIMFHTTGSILVERERVTLATYTVTGLHELCHDSHIAVDILGRNCYLAILYKSTGYNILTPLLHAMDHLIAVEIMAMTHRKGIEHITLIGIHSKHQRLAEGNLCRQRLARRRQKRTVICGDRKDTLGSVHIEDNITYCTSVLDYSIAILGTTGRVNGSPVHLVAHAVETRSNVSRQSERRRVEHIGIVYSRPCTVIPDTRAQIRFSIRESHYVTTLRHTSVTVKSSLKRAIHTTVNIDKTMHPIACKAERRAERLARHSLKATVCHVAVHLERSRQLQCLLVKRNTVQSTAAMSISLLLIEDYGIIHNSILVHKNHAVNIAHIGILVEKTYYILALLKHNIELGMAHTAPSGRLSCIYNRFAAIHAQFHSALLACYEVDTKSVLAAVLAVDIAPLQVILGLTAKPPHCNATRADTILGIYCCAVYLVVPDLLIRCEPCSLSLIHRAFKALISLKFINACTMGRNSYIQIRLIHAPIGLCKEIAHFHLAGKVKLREVHAHVYSSVCRIVERNHTFGPIFLLNILHKHITAVLSLYHICLQAQRVLVNGNKFFVLHQFKSIALYIIEIATDEQRRTHHTPHTEMGLVLLFG